MQLRSLILLVASLSMFACGSPSADPEATSANALSGSVTTSRACAARNAYSKAALSDLTPMTYASLPSALQAALTKRGLTSSDAAARQQLLAYVTVYGLQVPSVGRVFVVDATAADALANVTSDVELVDANGNVLAALLEEAGTARWFLVARTTAPIAVEDDGGTTSVEEAMRLLECAP